MHHPHGLLGLLRRSGGDQAIWSPPPVEHIRLDNGVQLVHAYRDHPLSAICVLHRFGFIDDLPGRPGFAHLLEHLASATDFSGEAVANAAHLNGRTRFDAIDFYALADDSDIVGVTRHMVARFALPPSHAQLEAQQAVVAAEIEANVTAARLGGFPWTELPAALFDDWSHAHNGYGTVDAVRSVSLHEVTDGFAEIRRRPLTIAVVGPVSARDAVMRVCETVPGFDGESARPMPDFLDGDRTVTTLTSDGINALALGAFPPGVRDLAAARVVARLLKRQTPPSLNSLSDDFGVGFFGRFSSQGMEPLIRTTIVGGVPDLEAHVAHFRNALSAVESAPAELIEREQEDEVLDLGAAVDDSVTFARQLAVMAHLPGGPAHALQSAHQVATDDVRRVAASLAQGPIGALRRLGEATG